MTVELVGFADAEALVIDYLTGELPDDVYVAGALPKSRRARMVRVTRTGGVRRDEVTDTPQITLECWDVDDEGAFGLARYARALLWALPDRGEHGHKVRHTSELGGPVYFEDPDTDLPRYQLTVTIEVRGEPLD